MISEDLILERTKLDIIWPVFANFWSSNRGGGEWGGGEGEFYEMLLYLLLQILAVAEDGNGNIYMILLELRFSKLYS